MYSKAKLFPYRTAIGIRGKDGVVLAVEKLVTSKLFEYGANKRVFNIDKHIGMCVAGLLADARAVVDIARDEAVNYRNQYRSPVPLKVANCRCPILGLILASLLMEGVKMYYCWSIHLKVLYLHQNTRRSWL